MLNEKIIDDDTILRLMLNKEDVMNAVLEKPLVITEVENSYDDMKNTSLYELFHSNIST